MEAQYHFDRAIGAAPESYSVYESLAKYHERRRELRLEFISLRKSPMWKPEQPALLNRLAYILAVHPDDSVRSGKEATKLARFACFYDCLENPDYRHTLAAALAETGDIEGAVRLTEDLLGEEGRPQTAGYRVRLARYRLGLPYRDPFLPDY